jgi:hypothetical protein
MFASKSEAKGYRRIIFEVNQCTRSLSNQKCPNEFNQEEEQS